MPLVPREKIDDVRDRTNIVEIIKRHVELKRAGTGSWKGLCPFHSEKTPSFHVHEPRQFFHCFGCGEKGDVISFLVKIEQRSFMEVLQDLAGAAGVDLDVRPLSPAERLARKEAESERDRMFRVMETAAAFFQEQYASPAGAAARAYVEKRGIGADVVQRFRVGYAPARWDGLSSFLVGKKIPASDLERLGLAGANERGRYDFFRDRVMLPVMDRQRRVIGFGGRLLDPEAKDRKYVNSPDSPLFHKKEQLYGLHAALDAIRKSGTAVVVEGNFDVMSLHEAGIEEAVAPMGTALTAEQVSLLGRLAHTVVVVFDGDAAGQRAAGKVIPLFVDGDVDGRIARMPSGVDPDDFVRAQGADAFRRLVDGARPMLDQFIQDATGDSTVEGRVATLDRVAALLVRVKNQTTRELYAAQLAGVLGMSPPQVSRALRAASAGASRQAAPAAAPAPEAARALPRDELELVLTLARYPELLGTPDATRAGELLVDGALKWVYRALLDQGKRIDISELVDAAPPDIRTELARALMNDPDPPPPNPASLLRGLVATLGIARVEAEIKMNGTQVENARSRADEVGVHALIKRGIELKQRLLELKETLKRP